MPHQPLRIVVVDDHAGFRRVASDLVEARGHAVVGEAACARQLWATLEACAADVVLLDIRLGAESGLDVARVLAREHPTVAVLLMSASDRPDGRAAVHACGAHGFAAKAELATVDFIEVRKSADRPGRRTV